MTVASLRPRSWTSAPPLSPGGLKEWLFGVVLGLAYIDVHCLYCVDNS